MDNQSNKSQADKEKLRQEYVNHILAMHEDWIKHPMTVMLAQSFNKFRESHLAKLNTMVGNPDIDANFFRAQAMNVKNTDAMINISFDPQAFVAMLLKQQEQPKD